MNRDLHALELFEKSLELPADERVRFLDNACADDQDLRDYVESLLGTQVHTQGFLVHERANDASTGIPTEDETLFQQSQPTESVIQIGSVLCGRYAIVDKIGTGGMGDVYQATDLQLDRDVAIKILNRESLGDSEMQRRFDRELRSIAALSHPHIVTLYDVATHQGVKFAVMEFIAGRTLRELIVPSGIHWQRAAKIAGDIASGLQSAHARDIMHRDIKPENIIVSVGGHAKVLDFGLARREVQERSLDQELTRAAITPGTPPYMSPEQAESEELSCATDVFSLGTVLFEMLTGINPFRAETALQTMHQITQSGPPSLTDYVKDLPIELNSLLVSMLDRQSSNRPSATEVTDRLRTLFSSPATETGTETHASKPTAMGDNSSALNNNAIPTNLPRRSGQLTGRDTVVADLGLRLADHPLVTVIGPGGVGKSSVAYEVARLAQHEFSGGVWLCELASLRKGEGVLKALAGALDGNAGTVNSLEKIIALLQGPQTLLVIDNCEHVIDAVSDLAQTLLQQLPNLTILATSRESLNIAEEYVCRIEGLSYIGSTSDAARLFRKRALAFVGHEQDQKCIELVEKIVTRLEGLPLAIELAAAKLAVMSLSELLEALDNQGSTLRSGRRLQNRQGTIDQTIAWSFDLLLPGEQQVLLELSVFASWFTQEAATDICTLFPLAKEHLHRLVEQSVIVRKEFKHKSHYRLLEPIRQFCQARINPEVLAVASERHARFYAKRAVILGRGVSGYDELASADALNLEWADLREAIAWGRKYGKMEVAVEPTIALDRTAMFHLRTEVFQWLIAAEKELGSEVASRADVCAIIANGYWIMGNPDLADAYLERSERIGANSQNAWVSFFLRGTQARYEEAIKHFEDAQRMAESSEDELELRWGASSLPVVLLTLIDPYDPRIDGVLSASEELLKKIDWPTGEALLHLALGNLANGRGKRTEARTHRQRAIEIASQCGSRWVELIANVTITDDLSSSVSPDQQLASAISTLRSMLDLNEKSSIPIAVRSIIIAMVACGDMEAAARCSAAVESFRGMGGDGKLNPLYLPAIEKIENELGRRRFSQLQAEGRLLTVHDILEIAAKISGSAS